MSTIHEGDKSLLEHLDIRQINCLNESEDHPLISILSSKSKNTGGSYLSSDADEQLLLNIPFNQTIKIRSLVIQSSNPAQAPKLVKIFINRPALGFEDVEDADESAAAQIIELTEEDTTNGNPLVLRFVRFQTVNSLHIFVSSNQGGEDETRIDAIDVLGVPIETTKNLNELKKQEET